MGCLILHDLCMQQLLGVFAASRVPGGSDDPALGYFYCSGAAADPPLATLQQEPSNTGPPLGSAGSVCPTIRCSH